MFFLIFVNIFSVKLGLTVVLEDRPGELQLSSAGTAVPAVIELSRQVPLYRDEIGLKSNSYAVSKRDKMYVCLEKIIDTWGIIFGECCYPLGYAVIFVPKTSAPGRRQKLG